MSKPRRLTKKVLQEDADAYAALLEIRNYDPNNPDFALDAITASHTKMATSRADEMRKQDALDAAKDVSAADEHAHHALILGAKTQVKGQFGENSNEFQSMGMKKKEEYKTGRRTKTPETT